MRRIICKFLIFGLVLAMGVCYFNSVDAGTTVATGADAQSGGSGAAVDLDFRVVIPSYIVFRVGSAGSTDTIEFTPSVAEVTAGTTGITGTGGDVGSGVVTVSIQSNAGGVRILEDNDGAGGGLVGPGTLSYSQINTADTGGGGITPPALSDAGTNFSDIPPTAGNVTDRTTQWTYTYDNPATPPAPGTYTGTVTYTAVIP